MEKRSMDSFQLPAGTQIAHVHLLVSSLEKALAFYRDLLGFQTVEQNTNTVALSANGQPPYRLVLTERPGARPKPARTTGLYHVAIRFPNRHELARVLQRLVAHRWPFQGFADHGVSEALYLADPDGSGLELYFDRPSERWRWQGGQIAMTTEPLDVEALLVEAEKDPSPWAGAPLETDVGHVHLHVSDLAQAEAFYHGLLGLDVTQRGYPGALFLSAGGYHHHLGVNVWAGVGAPPPPADAVGLSSFALRVPDVETWTILHERVQQAGLDMQDQGYDGTRSFLIRDADDNGVEVIVVE